MSFPCEQEGSNTTKGGKKKEKEIARLTSKYLKRVNFYPTKPANICVVYVV